MTYWKPLIFSGLASAAALKRATPSDGKLSDCPGYSASNVQTTGSGLTADLKLAGPACDAYGDDIEDLVLSVTYESGERIHVKIQDQGNQVYQIPESVFPRPDSDPEGSVGSTNDSIIKFDYVKDPFSFSIVRTDSDEVLFDTSAESLVFESQYLRLRTKLPEDPYLYGLGEHTDPFRLNTTDYTRTLWNRDSYAVPEGTNLYGSHPFYLEHRESGSHGVFLLNSNGMDIMINNTEETGQYLEYNAIGGVLDFWFLAGPGPSDVVQQYAEVAGLPAMQPYWGLGFHQCRYGYQDIFDVAEVVYNYSQANIPLETMWTDIDYMDHRAVFTLDPERFPLDKVRQLVKYLHDHQQHYIVMVDPAVAWQDYPTIERGLEDNIFLLRPNGSEYLGVVWPGVTVFPDWFAENITEYWNREFEIFFDPETGVDIDGLWIDMNEPADFCEGLCEDPWGDADDQNLPPEPPAVREWPRPLPGWPCDFQPPGTEGCPSNSTATERTSFLQALGPRDVSEVNMERLTAGGEGDQKGLPDRDLLDPQYPIQNAAADDYIEDNGGISFKTVNTDVIHENGLKMYDTHNLYGAMMGKASRDAMLNRRPGLRPLIITRSSFPGDGVNVGHWLGDNVANWEQYRMSIYSTMTFSAMYQFPMAGSDVCGFAGDTNEQLCARWASLGAFFTFYRNHNEIGPAGQEFYRWDSVAESARKAIAIRYRLLDYMYTAMYKASLEGSPVLNPMFFIYPEDKATWELQHQFFYGDGLLVAPVTEENATSVDAYLPEDTFYDWYTHETIQGEGASHTFEDQDVTDIPLLIRSGVILPLRVESANTTTELRKLDFELIIPLTAEGKAKGELYLDDGVSVEQDSYSLIDFTFEDSTLTLDGTFDFDSPVKITKIKILGASVTAQDESDSAFDVDLSLNEPGSFEL